MQLNVLVIQERPGIFAFTVSVPASGCKTVPQHNVVAAAVEPLGFHTLKKFARVIQLRQKVSSFNLKKTNRQAMNQKF